MLKKWKLYVITLLLVTGLFAIELNAAGLLDQNDFNDGTAGSWGLYQTSEMNSSSEVLNGEYVVHVNNGGDNPWDITLYYPDLSLQAGHNYTFRFKVRSDADTMVYAKAGDAGPPYAEYWNNSGTPVMLTAGEAVTLEGSFTMAVNKSPIELAFQLGGPLTGEVPFDVFFDDIYLEDNGLDENWIDPNGPGNLLSQSDFNDGTSGDWGFYQTSEGNAQPEVVDGEFVLHIFNGDFERWGSLVYHVISTMKEGYKYKVRFKARSTADTQFLARIGFTSDPYTNYWDNNHTDFTLNAGEELVYEHTFTMDRTVSPVAFEFHFGGDLTGEVPFDVFLDDVYLENLGQDPDYVKIEDPVLPKPVVRINQIGYFPNGKKRATILSDSTEPVMWYLKDSAGTIVKTGTTTVFGLDAASNDFVHQADFSAFTQAGTDYRLLIMANGEELASHAFDIRNDLYSRLKYDALGFFYQNRSGIAIKMPYAGREDLTRPAGHLPDIMSTWPGSGQEEYSLDLTGGWYDAGDYGKYVVNGGISVWTMMNQYERTLHTEGADRGFYRDGKMNIPENTNGIPDILDEARWEMEMLLSMQVPEGRPYAGMVHHKGHDSSETLIPYAPHEKIKNRHIVPPTTAATLHLAAVGSQAARIWKDLDPAFATRCLIAAEKAWNAALANPNMQTSPIEGGYGRYEDYYYADEFYWAGCELFITTAKDEYKDYIRNSELYLKILTPVSDTEEVFSLWWQRTHALGSISLAMIPNGLAEEDKTMIRNEIIKTADMFAATLEKEGYLLPMDSVNGYGWGSNSEVVNRLFISALAYDFSGENAYLALVTEGMDYLLGRNALDQSYISGYGERPFTNPHHRFWAFQADPSYPILPPGIISGGPSNHYAIPGVPDGTPPQKSYADHFETYTTNEVCINWSAPFAWVTAFIDEKMVPPLSVEIVRPVSGQELENGLILLKAKTIGDAAHVKFYVDGRLVSADCKAPYYGFWFSLEEGEHTVYAKVTGKDGREETSPEVIIKTVKNSRLISFFSWLNSNYRKYMF